MYLILAVLLFITPSLQAGKLSEQAFTLIYKYRIWGKNEEGKGTSGIGSTLEATEQYRAFLQGFLKEADIKSVVDLGCGDWEFSQTIDWSGVNYLGVDLVKPVIETNIERFGSPTINFEHKDGIHANLPPADLLICKDVLQHLPNKDIHTFIKQIPKFKYCLITNDVDPKTLTSGNRDVFWGDVRYLDLSALPFNVEAATALIYHLDIEDHHNTKKVLLITSKDQ
jgi:SAM-dependent methyltransferase